MLENMFSAPIPGQSLTNEPGNVPWEQPPQMVDLPEVVQYYTERLTEADGVDSVAELLKNDVPCVDVAKTLMRFSVMKGVHSVDIGMIALPVIVELVKTIGDLNDIDYSIVSPDEKAPKPPSESMILELLNQAKETMKADEDVNPEAAMPKKGLMARRVKEEM
jgi:hypothetical protein